MESFGVDGSVLCGVFWRRWPSENEVFLSLSPGFSSLCWVLHWLRVPPRGNLHRLLKISESGPENGKMRRQWCPGWGTHP